MPKSPSEREVRLFVSFGYATDGLKFAQFNCDQLLRFEDENSMAWLSEVTSLVAHYARPFKRSNDLPPLPDEFVPQTYRELHKRLIQARDKAHVHLDGNLRAGNGGALLHQVRLVTQRDGQHFWSPQRVLLIERKDIPTVKTLIKELLDRLDKETDRLEHLMLPWIRPLTPGLYSLSTLTPFFKADMRYDGIEHLDELGPIN